MKEDMYTRALVIYSVQTHLITGGTAWLQLFGIMSLAVEQVIVDAVGEVHQELLTHAAHEARGMPQRLVPKLGGYHPHLTHTNHLVALRTLLQHRAR
jgi:hypothetical protein